MRAPIGEYNVKEKYVDRLMDLRIALNELCKFRSKIDYIKHIHHDSEHGHPVAGLVWSGDETIEEFIERVSKHILGSE